MISMFFLLLHALKIGPIFFINYFQHIYPWKLIWLCIDFTNYYLNIKIFIYGSVMFKIWELFIVVRLNQEFEILSKIFLCLYKYKWIWILKGSMEFDAKPLKQMHCTFHVSPLLVGNPCKFLNMGTIHVLRLVAHNLLIFHC